MANSRRGPWRDDILRESHYATIAQGLAISKPREQLCRELNISDKQLRLDIAALRSRWRDSFAGAFSDMKVQELHRIEFALSEAWRAWFASWSPKTIETIRNIEVPGAPAAEGAPPAAATVRQETTVRRERRDPQQAMMGHITALIGLRVKILGLDEPREFERELRAQAEAMAKKTGRDPDWLFAQAQKIAAGTWSGGMRAEAILDAPLNVP